MIRRAEQTVRWPVVRRAPMARSWALVQTRSENNGAKVARMATISGGRSTGVISRPTACVPPSILVKDPRGLPANLAKVEGEGGDRFEIRAPISAIAGRSFSGVE